MTGFVSKRNKAKQKTLAGVFFRVCWIIHTWCLSEFLEVTVPYLRWSTTRVVFEAVAMWAEAFLPLHPRGSEDGALPVTVPCERERAGGWNVSNSFNSLQHWRQPWAVTWALHWWLVQSHPGEEPGFAPLLLTECCARHLASSVASLYICMLLYILIQRVF